MTTISLSPKQALAIASFEPGMYEVVEVFSGTSSEP
jgi:hypothetical protein